MRDLRHLLYLLVATLVAPACHAPQNALQPVVRAERGQLLRFGPLQVLVLRGSGYQMGLQHGRLLPSAKQVIAESLAWTERRGLSRAQLRVMFDQLAPHIPLRYREEMRGLADGCGAPLDDVELLHAMPSKFHCSGAAVARSMSRDGKLYHARSLDYPLDIGTTTRIQNHAVVLVRVPDDGIANAVPSWAGFLGAVTGLNDAGISIGEMGPESDDESLRGMPMIFMVREALRRANRLAAAVDVFRRGPRTAGFNFIVGSGDERQAVALEVTRSHLFVSGFGDPAEDRPPHKPLRDAVRRTNHFVGAQTAATHDATTDPVHGRSLARYQRITTFLEAHRGSHDADSLIRLMRGYPPKHACLHQAVMCSTDRVLWVANAVDNRDNPTAGAQNQTFYRVDLRALVAGRASTVETRTAH